MKGAQSANLSNGLAAIVFAGFAVVCIVAFLGFRGSDVGQLPKLIGNLGGGPLVGSGIIDSVVGLIVGVSVFVGWFGLGSLISRFIVVEQGDSHSLVLELVRTTAIGVAAWSLVWFFLGIGRLYSAATAIAVTVIGVGLAVIGMRRIRGAKSESRVPERTGIFDKVLLLMIAVPVALSFIAALAPPTAKDTLLYHFALPKAFIAQGSNAFVDGNIASYLSLGTEMHVVWARLLGGILSERAAETAGSVVVWLFFPLLLAAVFGWSRETGISRRWALVAVLMVAAVPTAYAVASSGYIDLALALFVTLAVYSLGRWWREPSTGTLVRMAIFLGAALAIKLTAVFFIAAFALVILLRARGAQNAGKLIGGGSAALLLAGVIASPWYIRTWAATGSPVFPFYMSIWSGRANGWDVGRSNLFQAMNSQYGGADVDKLNYLTAPVRVSVLAQPEQPANYDGVFGVAFLIGLPLLIWALWKFDLPVEAKVAAGVSGIMYLFWLFSSAQLRYLLPIAPALAIAIAASAEAIAGKVRDYAQVAFATASAAGVLTSLAWFCQAAPLRVALGGETRDQYLTRNLDYYPYYVWLNSETPPDTKVWLINTRRDTYNIDRPVFSDYLFEDWTFRNMLWESRGAQELKAKAASLGVQYVLTRHDFLFDYTKSTLVDDRRPRAENEAKLRMAKELILDPARTVKADDKFSLVKTF